MGRVKLCRLNWSASNYGFCISDAGSYGSVAKESFSDKIGSRPEYVCEFPISYSAKFLLPFQN
jgi:hypothetical protein